MGRPRRPGRPPRTGEGTRVEPGGAPPWHTVVGICALGWVVLYAGRAVLAPVLGALGAEWGLDEARLGLVSSVFFLAYAAAQVPTGLLADRFGKKRLLVGGLVAFGLATVLRGLAPSYTFFLVAAGLAGLAQGTYYPSQFAISSAAIPLSRRGLGSAVIYSGMAVGTSAGLILGSTAAFTLGLGWRAPFWLLAFPTAAVALLFARRVEEPRGGGDRSAHVLGPLPAGISAALSPRLLAAYALNFTSLYAFFMLLTWLPYYLQYERGLDASAAGLASSLTAWASIPGALIVGALSDRVGDRMRPLRVLLPAAAVSVAGLAYVQSVGVLCVLLILYGLVGKSTVDPLLVARVSELAPPQRSATALSFLNFAGMLASVVAPYATGVMAETFGTMRPGFYVAAAVLLAGSVVALAVSPGPAGPGGPEFPRGRGSLESPSGPEPPEPPRGPEP